VEHGTNLGERRRHEDAATTTIEPPSFDFGCAVEPDAPPEKLVSES
jgi:hypothetical protein